MREFKLPELGENISSATVTRVLVNVGDAILQDQAVVELETDKATVEVPSSVAGIVKTINVKAGDTVEVGAVMLAVDEGLASEAAAPIPAGPEPQRDVPADRAASKVDPSDEAASGDQQHQVEPIGRPRTDRFDAADALHPPYGRRGEVVAMARPARRPSPARLASPRRRRFRRSAG